VHAFGHSLQSNSPGGGVQVGPLVNTVASLKQGSPPNSHCAVSHSLGHAASQAGTPVGATQFAGVFVWHGMPLRVQFAVGQDGGVGVGVGVGVFSGHGEISGGGWEHPGGP
jgi:hypothetical protein